MTALNVVSLSASPHEPSKTTALLDAVTAALSQRLDINDQRVLISRIGPQLGRSLTRGGVGVEAATALEAVEACDLLVVSTPVYRATYTGLFKHFFDFVGQDALVGTPVFLSAVGGNNSHSLSIDHQLRPLFGFFRAVALPVGVFAENAEFDAYVPRDKLTERIASAVDQGMPVLRAMLHKVPG